MKERPILMSGPMVRASLRDQDPKTQTRRAIAGIPTDAVNDAVRATGRLIHTWGFIWGPKKATEMRDVRCPYGQPGDRLWVRETWATPKNYADYRPRDCSPTTPIYYEADKSHGKLVRWTDEEQELGRLRPSIFMPRWASRITLEIVSVRVERLQEISEADAKAEGVEVIPGDFYGASGTALPRAYKRLWESINGPGSWALNHWVWVLDFKRIQP